MVTMLTNKENAPISFILKGNLLQHVGSGYLAKRNEPEVTATTLAFLGRPQSGSGHFMGEAPPCTAASGASRRDYHDRPPPPARRKWGTQRGEKRGLPPNAKVVGSVTQYLDLFSSDAGQAAGAAQRGRSSPSSVLLPGDHEGQGVRRGENRRRNAWVDRAHTENTSAQRARSCEAGAACPAAGLPPHPPPPSPPAPPSPVCGTRLLSGAGFSLPLLSGVASTWREGSGNATGLFPPSPPPRTSDPGAGAATAVTGSHGPTPRTLAPAASQPGPQNQHVATRSRK
ncbi:hypothetical protein H920_06870 [Fukomys damarensis]|uniref:Uncharacterized protein n=1 Tax=Fukomys damarensis TaxID=885580 RepID=A0A091E911_FUKDA|nr:hypothetical protein H920_06870 [Fukomys damarensis]